MSDITDQVDESDFSLADLADLDVSEIAEVRFESLPPGSYEFEVTDTKMDENTNKDGERRFTIEFELTILEVKAVLKAGVDKASLVGKKHNEKMFINPGAEDDKVKAAIGRVRALVTDMGGESAGKLGVMVENMKGHRFVGKIVSQKDKVDKSIEYARLKLDPKKPAKAS